MAKSLGSSPNPAKGRCLAAVTGRKGPSHVLGELSWWRSTCFGLAAAGLLRDSESPSLPLRRAATGRSLGRWRARGGCWATAGVTVGGWVEGCWLKRR
ncbi:hypothetical protein PanWU01x14_207080 [Parasponia andersonii]|uniref:Uncharacterized protein n=1 Tax=Parasponia andersonii TaxID=3476 RepID=A0A2P5BVC8_PARAD|nr:hypothetical protein PanWU01x14_207080 [Parasponia andersonii]